MIWFISCLMLTVPCLCCVFHLPEGLFPWAPNKRAGYLRERKDTVCEKPARPHLEGKAGRLPHVHYASLKSFFAGRSYHPTGRDRPSGKKFCKRNPKHETWKEQKL